MAAAQQLNRAGHTVTVLKETMLLVYCVTEFQTQIRKRGIIDRRIVLEAEGIFSKLM
jgi:NADPH-dependent glutamate synthase beta subunit-like oxidoreductase